MAAGNYPLVTGTEGIKQLSAAHIVVPAVSTTLGGGVQFLEGTDGGTNYLALTAPATIATTFSLQLPSSDGSSGHVLKTDGSGNLSFAAAAGDIEGVTAGAGLSGGGSSGAVSLAVDISEFSNVAPAHGDRFLTLDTDGANEQLTTTTALATLFAGTGLAATNAVIAVEAAQTVITSLLATDIKIGEDDQTKIDFEAANEIHFYANNVEQVYLADNIFGPQSDSDVDFGTTGARWKDAFVDSITVTGEVDAASLDVSGDADIDGILEADAITIGGTALNTVIAAVTVTNATTAAAATTVTLTDESSDTTCFPVFSQAATGNIAMETDASALTYNAGTGSLAATTFVGALTGNASGSSGSCTGLAATATALATGRTINGTSFDGTANITVTAAGSTLSDTVTIAKGGTGATSVAAAAAALLDASQGGSLNIGDGSDTITIPGAAVVTGDLTVNGTTTTVNSTTVTLDDPIITLGGDTAPGSNDGKDRGVEFRWHNGSAAKVGFFGYDNSKSYLTFIPDASNTSEVFSGTQGTISALAFNIGDNAILSGTTLGSTIVTSSLTTVGAIGTGSWAATDVAVLHGGTGASTAAGARTNLGVAIGSNVQAYDAELAAIAGLTSAANKGITFTGDGTAGVYDLTAAALTLLDDANVSTMRTTLGVAIGSDVQAYDAQLASVAAWTAAQVTTLGTIGTVTTGASQIIVTSSADTFAAQSCTAAGLALLDDADAAAQLVTLGVAATAAEITIAADGNTSATATTLVDADRVVVNDGGTMKQVAFSDLQLYLGLRDASIEAGEDIDKGMVVSRQYDGSSKSVALKTATDTHRTVVGLALADVVDNDDNAANILKSGSMTLTKAGEDVFDTDPQPAYEGYPIYASSATAGNLSMSAPTTGNQMKIGYLGTVTMSGGSYASCVVEVVPNVEKVGQ